MTGSRFVSLWAHSIQSSRDHAFNKVHKASFHHHTLCRIKNRKYKKSNDRNIPRYIYCKSSLFLNDKTNPERTETKAFFEERMFVFVPLLSLSSSRLPTLVTSSYEKSHSWRTPWGGKISRIRLCNAFVRHQIQSILLLRRNFDISSLFTLRINSAKWERKSVLDVVVDSAMWRLLTFAQVASKCINKCINEASNCKYMQICVRKSQAVEVAQLIENCERSSWDF